MYGVEERLEWLSDYNGQVNLCYLLSLGINFDELFEIDDYDVVAYLEKTDLCKD